MGSVGGTEYIDRADTRPAPAEPIGFSLEMRLVTCIATCYSVGGRQAQGGSQLCEQQAQR